MWRGSTMNFSMKTRSSPKADFASDRQISGFLGELGLAGKLIFRKPVTVMHHEGRFYPFDSPLAALRFPGLGWGLDKLRFDPKDRSFDSSVAAYNLRLQDILALTRRYWSDNGHR